MSALLGVLGAAALFALFAYGALRFGAVERGGTSCGAATGEPGSCGVCALFGTAACERASNHDPMEQPGDDAAALRGTP